MYSNVNIKVTILNIFIKSIPDLIELLTDFFIITTRLAMTS